MSEHPVRLLMNDDLERTRLTVVVRVLLAIPHLIWVPLWGIAAICAVIASWFITLVRGQTPESLHRFLATYVKYVTQVYGYLYLAADPYPPFDGRDGYPIDLVIAGPARQSRWRVAFRVILVIPALLLSTALAGSPGGRYVSGAGRSAREFSLSGPGLLVLLAVLGWFVVLARGRMPRGLRDAAAYCISYGAQTWGYLLLLTDRYPDSDPQAALPELPACSAPARLEIDDDLTRNRLTVFFRLLLAIPHFIWLALWAILVLLAVIAAWLAALATGRVPRVLVRFMSAYLRYQLHVYGFFYLVANPFPGFVGRTGSYPLEAIIEAAERQSRWKVLLRLPLALPALLVLSAYNSVAGVAAVLGWFAALVTGRMPRGLRNVGVLALGYHLQAGAYLLLLCEAYPYAGPCRTGDSSAWVPVGPAPSSTVG